MLSSTPNKKTALVSAVFEAATSNAGLSPLDFLLGVMRDSSVSPDWRFKAAQTALPYVHSKSAPSPQTDPELTVKQVEAVPIKPEDDPLWPVFQAYSRVSAERLKAAQKVKVSRDVDDALVSDGLLD